MPGTSTPTAYFRIVLAVWAVLFLASPVRAEDRPLHSLEAGMNELVYQISRYVVTVECLRKTPSSFAGATGEGEIYNVVSSGIIVDSLGRIVVASRTVAGCEQILIDYHHRVFPARLVGVDYQSGLALITIDQNIGRYPQIASQPGCAGQMVVAIGNAFGCRASPSIGFCAGTRSDGMVQFSAQVTSGTVGGGLFNLSGQLLGIVVGGVGGELAGTGLAYSAHRLSDIIEYLLTRGDRLAGYIGVTTTDMELVIEGAVDPVVAESNGAAGTVSSATSPSGDRERMDDYIRPQSYRSRKAVLIRSVSSASPAAAAGLIAGDLLLSVDGQPVGSGTMLESKVRSSSPGTRLQLDFLRRKVLYSVSVRVADLSSSVPNGIPYFPDYKNSDVSTDSLSREVEALRRAVQQIQARLTSRSR